MPELMLDNVLILGDEGDPILTVDHFTLEKATFLAIKGVSGAGKSTFLNTISGLITPDRGEVFWQRLNFGQLNRAKKSQFRRNSMGLIFQDFPLFEELSVFENITVSKHYLPEKNKTIEANAKRLMKQFAFNDATRASQHYSGGQKQRIAFMRALVADPIIIIADEPTAALDEDNAKVMIDFLVSETKEKTVIVTSHDEYVLDKADRVLTIDGGKIVEDTANVRHDQ